ncbi:multicopper oxidase domain-containing protein [Streptomyces achromogenes]|uniref:multicopper oxidase domain-containing protein n=1 Tax=Streptomyces achromogenes TaxID=67255 RepID=UPI003F4CFB16
MPAATAGELTPYLAPLTVPPVLRPATDDVLRETEIASRPAWVRLHPQLPPTLMWGYDGQRIMGRFDGGYGRFMYHCHLLEHEDMGMMRPFVVMPPEALKFSHDGAHDGHGHTG